MTGTSGPLWTATCSITATRCCGGDESAQPIYYDRDTDPDGDIVPPPDADPAEAFRVYAEEVAAARVAVEGHDLSETFVSRRGATLSLRWVYVHMVQEYARHNGHADLLREAIDGVTGE